MLENNPLLKIINKVNAKYIYFAFFLKTKTNNSTKTKPNGEKIKGNNLLSKYVSITIIYTYSNEIDCNYPRIFLF